MENIGGQGQGTAPPADYIEYVGSSVCFREGDVPRSGDPAVVGLDSNPFELENVMCSSIHLHLGSMGTNPPSPSHCPLGSPSIKSIWLEIDCPTNNLCKMPSGWMGRGNWDFILVREWCRQAIGERCR